MMRATTLVSAVAAALLTGACGEKAQNMSASNRKGDAKASSGAQAAYQASGWKAGDQADWQRQITQRAQAQNEHVRLGTIKSTP